MWCCAFSPKLIKVLTVKSEMWSIFFILFDWFERIRDELEIIMFLNFELHTFSHSMTVTQFCDSDVLWVSLLVVDLLCCNF